MLMPVALSMVLIIETRVKNMHVHKGLHIIAFSQEPEGGARPKPNAI